jgi:ADP-ribose pyrophosphatase
MIHKYKVHARQTVFNEYLLIEKLLLQHELTIGGFTKPLTRYILHRPDAVCAIVRHVERDTLFFVRQFRVGVFEKEAPWTLELAAGLVDEGESKEEALRREIREELGYDARNLSYIRHFFPTPGICDERVYLYYVEIEECDKVHAGGGNPLENEDLELVEIPCSEVPDLLDNGMLQDAKTILGIHEFLRLQKQ